mgnify:CR=1 FL=1
MKILLIEDDDIDILCFLRKFESQHCILIARDATIAIQYLDKTVDLIVCDYFLPGCIQEPLLDVIGGFGLLDRTVLLSGGGVPAERAAKGVPKIQLLKNEVGYMELERIIDEKARALTNNDAQV